MRSHYMSLFWYRGGHLTSPIWAARDAEWEAEQRQVCAAEALDMGAWLKLADGERAAIVASYARRPAQRLAPAAAAE